MNNIHVRSAISKSSIRRLINLDVESLYINMYYVNDIISLAAHFFIKYFGSME
jgi:hypothetical protein